MSTKELIHQEIDNLDEAYLEELYQNIRHFAQVKEQSEDFLLKLSSALVVHVQSSRVHG